MINECKGELPAFRKEEFLTIENCIIIRRIRKTALAAFQ